MLIVLFIARSKRGHVPSNMKSSVTICLTIIQGLYKSIINRFLKKYIQKTTKLFRKFWITKTPLSAPEYVILTDSPS